jgi:hypothetical protein
MITVRGQASQDLAKRVERAQAARAREEELKAEQRAKAEELDGLRGRRIELLQQHEAAALDGRKAARPKALPDLDEQIEQLAGQVERGSADAIEALRREREQREREVVAFIDAHRDELLAEVMPAVLEAEEAAKGHVGAAVEAYRRASEMAFNELDRLLQRMPGGQHRVLDPLVLNQKLAELERIATEGSAFVPRALLLEHEAADAEVEGSEEQEDEQVAA